ncbi:MAG: hypothetical protein U0892_21590 [Pirellulales bacterium]
MKCVTTGGLNGTVVVGSQRMALTDAGSGVRMDSGAGIFTSGGNVSVSTSLGNILLGLVDAGTGKVHLRAGDSILDNNAFSTLSSDVTAGSNQITVTSAAGFAVGDIVSLLDGDSKGEVFTVTAIVGNTLTLSSNLVGDFTIAQGATLTALNVRASELTMIADSDVSGTGSIGASDAANGVPDRNANAVDTQVDKLAVSAPNNIYIREVDGVEIGNTSNVNVEFVNFRSDTSPFSWAGASGLASSIIGVVKLQSVNGDIAVNSSVATTSGDVLLQTLSATGDINANSSVFAVGNASLIAGRDIGANFVGHDVFINSSVDTVGLWSMVIKAGNDVQITNAGQTQTILGDLLIDAGRNVSNAGLITSRNANVGVVAGNDFSQSADVTAGLDVLVYTGRDWTMTNATASAFNNILGISLGNQSIWSLVAGNTVALSSGGTIVDGKADETVNIQAVNVSLDAADRIGDSDVGNVDPDHNVNAIDLRVSNVEALALNGIYLHQVAIGGNLTVTDVPTITVTVSTSQVQFNSTTAPAGRSETAPTIDGIETTNGPIKVVVDGGSINVGTGLLAPSHVTATGAGDILLQSTFANGDINAYGAVTSQGGDISVIAPRDIFIQTSSGVSTNLAGTIYLVSGRDLHIDAAVQSDLGDILADAGSGLTINASITSTFGNVGTIAGAAIDQFADIVAGRDILVDAGTQWTMVNAAARAGGNVLGLAGDSINLWQIVSGATVSLSAGTDIIDNKSDETVNITAVSAALRAAGRIGGSDLLNGVTDRNVHAIDLDLTTVAADAGTGIYLREIPGGNDLIVDDVQAVTVTVNPQRVEFRSTEFTDARTRNIAGLSDLTNTSGPIKVLVENGSLLVNGGTDGNGYGVHVLGTGDIQLQALNATETAGGDVSVASNAKVESGLGHVTINAYDDVVLNSNVITTGGAAGTVFVRAMNKQIDADSGVTMSSGSGIFTSGGDVIISAETEGNILLGLIEVGTAHVTLAAEGSILDNNGFSTLSADAAAGTNQVTLTNAAGFAVGDVVSLLDDTNEGEVFTIVGITSNTLTLSGNLVGSFAAAQGATLTALNVRADQLTMFADINGNGLGRIGDADAANGVPDRNVNAIDTQVNRLSATAAEGIYIREVDGVRIDRTDNISVQHVNFRSDTSVVPVSGSVDLFNTTSGVIKLQSVTGDIVVNQDNLVTDRVFNSAGDVLLQTLSQTGDVHVNGLVYSAFGDISIVAGRDVGAGFAGRDVFIDAPVSADFGTILIKAGRDISVTDGVTAHAGDIVVEAGRDVSTFATPLTSGDIVSDVNDVAVIAGRDFNQNTLVSAGNDALVMTGSNWKMTSATLQAGNNVLGNSVGSQAIWAIASGNTVSLSAGADITDSKVDENVNITAVSVALRAGGRIGGSDLLNVSPNANVQAIDLNATNVAAVAQSGIHLLEVAAGGDLNIAHVNAVAVSVDVKRVNFNSTEFDVNRNDTLAALDDLTNANGPIKVLVEDGTLTVTAGLDGNGYGVHVIGVGDILLQAQNSGLNTGADLVVQSGAIIESGRGHITLQAADDVSLGSNVVTTGGTAGTVYIAAFNNKAEATDGFVMNSGVGLFTGGGSVAIGALNKGDIRLGLADAGTGDVFLYAEGSIIDNNGFSTLSADAAGGTNQVTLADASGFAVGDVVSLLDDNSDGEVFTVIGIAGNTLTLSANLTGDFTTGQGATLTALNVRADELQIVADGDSDGIGSIGDSDTANGVVERNAKAIDTQINVLAGIAAQGIYIREVDGLSIDTTNNVSVEHVNFRSDTVTAPAFGTSHLRNTTSGAIKLQSVAGDLYVNQSALVTDSVLNFTSGDVLLQTLSLTGDIHVNGEVHSTGGDVTILAGRGVGSGFVGQDVFIDSQVTTTLSGTILITAGRDATVNSMVQSINGDIVVETTRDISSTAAIRGEFSDVAILAGRDYNQNALTFGGHDVLIQTGRDWTMTAATTDAGNNLLGISGGNQAIWSLSATQTVSLSAGGNITDNRAAEFVNITAPNAALRAGGRIGGSDLLNAFDHNVNAIDLNVINVAASATAGIHLLEVEAGHDLNVANVSAVSVSVDVKRANFNSTEFDVNRNNSLATLDDLTNAGDGPIKVKVEDGTLTVTPGLDGNGYGVQITGTGDILLQAQNTLNIGADVIVQPNARIQTGQGHITLRAFDDVVVGANVYTTGGVNGTVYIKADNNKVDADTGVVMATGIAIQTSGGNVQIEAGNEGNILLGLVDAGSGNVFLSAEGSIVDNNGFSKLSVNAGAGSNQVTLIDASGFAIGDVVSLLDDDSEGEVFTVVGIAGNTLTLSANLSDGFSVAQGAALTALNVRADQLRMIADTNLNGVGRIGNSDAANGVPERNAQAIDTQVNRVSALSAQGIYIREVDGVRIDVTDDIVVRSVNFRSDTSALTTTGGPNLSNATSGVIKLQAVTGDIAVNQDNAVSDGVLNFADDILLQTLSTTGDIHVNGMVYSAFGDISIIAGRGTGAGFSGRDVFIDAPVTADSGTILIKAGRDISVTDVVTAHSGDIVVEAGRDVTTVTSLLTSGDIVSDVNDVAVIAGRDFNHNSLVFAGRDAFVQTGRTWTMTGATLQVGRNALARSTAGNMAIWTIIAGDTVSLSAFGDITDSKADETVNITATNAALRAGGRIGGSELGNVLPDSNLNAIDLNVTNVAADAQDGIHLREVTAGGDLNIANVKAVAVSVDVKRVNFNSTEFDVNRSDALATLDDLTNHADGPIKVLVENGTLTVTTGLDGNGYGVHEVGIGDVMLLARNTAGSFGADVIVQSDARVQSGQGHITIQAADDVVLGSNVITTGGTAGTVYIAAGNNQTDAATGIVMNSGVGIYTSGGNVLLHAQNESDILLGFINAGAGKVELYAEGSIIDNNGFSTLSANAAAGSNQVTLTDASEFAVGDVVSLLDNDSQGEVFTVLGIAGNTLTLSANLSGAFTTAMSATLTAVNVRADELRMVADGNLNNFGHIGNSDAANGVPTRNAKAIDTQVNVLSTYSAEGTYVREVDGLRIDTTANVNVERVNFRSDTTTFTGFGGEDMVTTSGGVIKLQSVTGDIDINSGTDLNYGVFTFKGGDILLETLSSTGSINVFAPVLALSAPTVDNNVSLISGGGIFTVSEISAESAGTIQITAHDIVSLGASVKAVNGDILLHSDSTIFLIALNAVESQTNDVAITTPGTFVQNGTVKAGQDVLVNTGGDWNMFASTVQTGRNLVAESGGDQNLWTVIAGQTASLSAVGNIFDAKADETVNITAINAALRSGGSIGKQDLLNVDVDRNVNAIDLDVTNVAAVAQNGIYLRETVAGGDLNVDNVPKVTVSVDVQQVNFNSTETAINTKLTLDTLNDLTVNNGPIKVLTENGTLTVKPGIDGNGYGVRVNGTGNIQLQAQNTVGNTGADVIVQANAVVQSGQGHVTVQAADDVFLSSNVVTTGGANGTVYVYSGNNKTTDVESGVRMDSGVAIHTSGGNILIEAANLGDIRLGLVDAQAGDVSLLAEGSIIDNNAFSLVTSVLTGSNQVTVVNASGFAVGDVVSLLDDDSEGEVFTVTAVTGNTLTLSANVIGSFDTAQKATLTALNVRGDELRMAADTDGDGIGKIGDKDNLNGEINRNIKAVDTQVNVLSASAAQGIYIREVDGVVVDTTSDVVVRHVNFRSDTSAMISLGDSDLTNTDAGVIKLQSVTGNIVINPGADATYGVRNLSNGDNLLQTLSATANIIVNGPISAEGGHISLIAGRVIGATLLGHDVSINAAVSTKLGGTVLVQAGHDVSVAGSIHTVNGDVLVTANHDIASSALITSDTNDIGITAGHDFLQSGSIVAGKDVLIQTTGNWTMTASAVQAGNNLLAISTGTQKIWTLTAGQTAALDAGGSILDAKSDTTVNITAINLLLRAGGAIGSDSPGFSPTTNANAVDTNVSTVAARADSGIYLREVGAGGDLVVNSVAPVSATIDTVKVNFNSTTDGVQVAQSIDGREDLTTVNNDVQVGVVNGSLVILPGSLNPNGISAAGAANNIRLEVAQSILVGATIHVPTSVDPVHHRIVLKAGNFIDELAKVGSPNESIAKIEGDYLEITAGTYAHLHDTTVNTLKATVTTNGGLQAWQTTNSEAATAGTNFLPDAMSLDGSPYTEKRTDAANQVITNNTNDKSDAAIAALTKESFTDIKNNFNYSLRYDGSGYALFVKNSGTLTVADVNATGANRPNVYIETGAKTAANPAGNPFAELIVSGTILTKSTTADAKEGGIVLVAGGTFTLNGQLETISTLPGGIERIQTIQKGNDLKAEFYDGGKGIPGSAFLQTTKYVVPKPAVPVLLPNDTAVYQKVLLQFGQKDEAGFVAYIGYADGVVQQFDVRGLILDKTHTTFDTTDIQSIPEYRHLFALPDVLSDNGAILQRATAFNADFLHANQILPTVAVIRRADDFFIFQDAATAVKDLTFAADKIEGVFSQGDVGGLPLPQDLPPVRPLDHGTPSVDPLLIRPAQQIQTEVELVYLPDSKTEVAVYFVPYNDENHNGQPDANEIPNRDDILGKKGSSDGENGATETKGLKEIAKLKSASGGKPSAEDIDRLKAELLNNPQAKAGVYAIIETEADKTQVILDVFPLRDYPDDNQQEDVNGPLIELPKPQGEGNGADAKPAPAKPEGNSGAFMLPDWNRRETEEPELIERSESRFADAGLVAGALFLLQGSIGLKSKPKEESAAAATEDGTVRFDRAARRRRRRAH